MSKRKSIKIRTFPDPTIADIIMLKFFIMLHLRKSPDKKVLPTGTNDVPHATPKEVFNAVKDVKSFIQKYAPESKIIISKPVLGVDKVLHPSGKPQRYFNRLFALNTQAI